MNAQVINFNFFDPKGSIEFKNATGPNPILPLVQASLYDNTVEVSANIFINAAVPITKGDISVKQDEENRFLFFIIYNNDVQPNSVAVFRNYRVDFTIPGLKPEDNHGEIVVYLKDNDPVLSRGTVTTVQHTKGTD
jgi:hypothetical protein